MIARVEDALQTHARDMNAQTTYQQKKATRRYEALERLLKEKEEARQDHLLKQQLSVQRRENAVKTLAEIDLNRSTLLQYNLHVKELKRRRFLELKIANGSSRGKRGSSIAFMQMSFGIVARNAWQRNNSWPKWRLRQNRRCSPC